MAWTNADANEFETIARHRDRDYLKGSLKSLITLLKTPNPTKEAVQRNLNSIAADKKKKYRRALSYLRRHLPGVDEVARGNLRLQAFTDVSEEDAKMNRAELAMGRCQEVVDMCRKALEKVVPATAMSKNPAQWSKTETRATELFKIWLDGSRGVPSVNRVRTVFATMAQALRDQVWEVVLYGTVEQPDPENYGSVIANAYAFVIPAENAYRVYLGSLFWREADARIDTPTVTHAFAPQTQELWRAEKKLKSAMDAAVVTTVHELCHVTAISGGTAITDVAPSPYDWKVCKQNAKDAPNLALTNAENYAMFGSSLLMEQMFF
jgi:Lysine-specific metallo-endopeptidase